MGFECLYSTHSEQYSIPSKYLKELHLCKPRQCSRTKPSTNCFRRFYESADPFAVYHPCEAPSRCKFVKTNPETRHVPLEIKHGQDTLSYGKPLVDHIAPKLTDWSRSAGQALESTVKFLQSHRSPSTDFLDNIEASNSFFSINLGKTSDVRMEAMLKEFKVRLSRDASKLVFLPLTVCAFDVEGKVKHPDGDYDLPSKLHFGNGYSVFLEINIPSPDKIKELKEIPVPLLEFFEDSTFLFIGNDCCSDLVQIESLFSLIKGSYWQIPFRWLDTIVLWTTLGGWAKDSYGLSTMLNTCVGGFLQKPWRLSCADDWSKPWSKLGWQYNLYNLGDQLTIYTSFYTFLVVIGPTAFPDYLHIKTALDQNRENGQILENPEGKELPLTLLYVMIVTCAEHIVFCNPLYQISQDSDRNTCIYLWKVTDKSFSRLPLAERRFVEENLDKVNSGSRDFFFNWGLPKSAVHPSWTPSTDSVSTEFAKWFLVQFDSDPGNCEGEIVEEIEEVDEEVIEEVEVMNEEVIEEIEEVAEEVTELESDRPEVSWNHGVRLSRFEQHFPPGNPSGFNPSPDDLADCAGYIHMRIDRHGREYTVNARSWRDYLSIREMRKVVGYSKILDFVYKHPRVGLRWLRSVPAWGDRPGPLHFRFGDGRWYRDVRRIVEDRLGIRWHNPHPYNQTRAGRFLKK